MTTTKRNVKRGDAVKINKATWIVKRIRRENGHIWFDLMRPEIAHLEPVIGGFLPIHETLFWAEAELI